MKLDAKTVLAIIYLFVVSGLFFFPDRSHFFGLFSLYLISIAVYFYSLKCKEDYLFSFPIRSLSYSGNSFCFSIPVLSNDFYRFLWDGELFVKGINPYAYKPVELVEQSELLSSQYFISLYEGMESFSKSLFLLSSFFYLFIWPLLCFHQ